MAALRAEQAVPRFEPAGIDEGAERHAGKRLLAALGLQRFHVHRLDGFEARAREAHIGFFALKADIVAAKTLRGGGSGARA